MIERTIYNDGMLVVTKCSGEITGDELVRSAHWMIDNYGSQLKPGFMQVFDALDAVTDAITEEDIHQVAHININQGTNRAGFTMAILARQPYPRALARLHKLLSAAAGIRVEIFCSYVEAFEWLGIDDPRT